jgi:hypothetical protein
LSSIPEKSSTPEYELVDRKGEYSFEASIDQTIIVGRARRWAQWVLVQPQDSKLPYKYYKYHKMVELWEGISRLR